MLTAGLPDAHAFAAAVRSMTEQGRDAYSSQATPLYTQLTLGPMGRLYVGRRFAKREEAAQGWTHVYNVQARSTRPSDVWYAEHLPHDCALELYTLPRSNDNEGATDKAIMKVVDHVVAAARAHPPLPPPPPEGAGAGGEGATGSTNPPVEIFIHDNEEGAGPAAIIGTVAWAILTQADLSEAPVPEEEHCRKQLKRLLKAVAETLESAWRRGGAAAAAAAAVAPAAGKK